MKSCTKRLSEQYFRTCHLKRQYKWERITEDSQFIIRYCFILSMILFFERKRDRHDFSRIDFNYI